MMKIHFRTACSFNAAMSVSCCTRAGEIYAAFFTRGLSNSTRVTCSK